MGNITRVSAKVVQLVQLHGPEMSLPRRSNAFKYDLQFSNVVQDARFFGNELGQPIWFERAVFGIRCSFGDVDDHIVIEVSFNDRGKHWVFRTGDESLPV